MLKEIVEVVTASENTIRIKIQKQKMCSCCRYSALCGKGSEEIMLSNNGKNRLQKGDRIEIGIEEKKNIFAALLLFFTPAVIFLACIIFFPSTQEYNRFLIGLLAVATYYALIKIILKKRGRYFDLKILQKLES
ncbi:MAG: SoxR reducing system RseC family protein [Candidatus Omnitrophota bacterium]|nr:MAG: SoxR reducing system RseC family protein [Candidatus Omnitrophota bacterium]